jgi:putative methyltransferase (TIGR04325 family)
MNKELLKDILPPVFIRLMSGIIYGWHGNYSSWGEAKKKVSGYDSKIILDKVKESALKVRDGEAVFERDSVLFDKIHYSFPLLSGLMWIAALKKGKLNVLDFGGSLGTTYFQNRTFLDSLEVNWCIVEQPEFVKEGIDNFSNNSLHFFYSVEDCMKKFDIDVMILSSVLQYLEDPFGFIDKVIAFDFKYLLIDRTPFIKGEDRITIQRVNPKIYKANYPCWFFNKENFLSKIESFYNLLLDFEALDRANIQSDFLGFLFVRI